MKKMTVGEKIRSRRKFLEMSQEKLADKAGISALTIVRVENGQFEPKLKTLRSISKALSLEVEELVALRQRGRRRKVKQLEEDLKNLKAMGMKAIARQYEGMAQALRVIHTWASCDKVSYTLIPDNTEKLCEKALRRFR